MKAMVLNQLSQLSENSYPLKFADIPLPEPQKGEIQIRVSASGVCHTELDEIEGRTPPSRFPMVPGHEVVGTVSKLGAETTLHKIGDRVGVGWIFSSSGAEDENLSPEFKATGRDVNGGYAEYMTALEQYAYPIPAVFSDEEAAPLLCAGGVGYRALRLTQIADGAKLGLMGFGGSAHLVLQLAQHLYPNARFYVFARERDIQEFALKLGATWAGNIDERAPELLDAIIDTTPAWKPVIEALLNLRAGGRLVINAIRKEDDDKECLVGLSYAEHLWLEKEIKTVANVTSKEIREFLQIAAAIPVKPTVQVYNLEQANEALLDLKTGKVRGAKVLRVFRR